MLQQSGKIYNVKRFTTFFLAIIWGQFTLGQASYTEKFYTNFVSGDMDAWQVNLHELKQNYNTSKSTLILEQIIKAQYGLIAYLIGSDEKKKADKELDQAFENIEILIDKHPNRKELLAWKGAFYGFGMGIDPWKLFYFGPKSQEYIMAAFKVSEKYSEVNFEYANMRFWAPSIVGGNKNEALIYYKKTIDLIEKSNLTKGWYYLWALTAYYNAVKEVKGLDAAKPIYQKIIDTEPNYKWIKEELANFPTFDL